MAFGLTSRLGLLALGACLLASLTSCGTPAASEDGELVRMVDDNGNPYYVRRKAADNSPQPKSNNTPKGNEGGTVTNPDDEFCLVPPEAQAIAASGLKVGAKAPNWKLKTLDGSKEISLADYKGKTLMIEFWASWCPGCRTSNEENLRPLFAANQASADSNLAIIAIGLTFNDDTAEAQKAVAETKEYPWTLVFDEGAKVSDAYGVGVTPCVVVVSPEGVVQTYGLYRREWAANLDKYLTQNCVTKPPK